MSEKTFKVRVVMHSNSLSPMYLDPHLDELVNELKTAVKEHYAIPDAGICYSDWEEPHSVDVTVEVSDEHLASLIKATITSAEAKIKELTREVDVLRQYGNKDCTAMADEAIAKLRQALKENE